MWQGLRGVAGLAQMTSVVTPVWLWASVAPLSWTRAARVTVQSVVVTGAPCLSIREPLKEGQGAHWAFHDSEVGRGKFGPHWEGAV